MLKVVEDALVFATQSNAWQTIEHVQQGGTPGTPGRQNNQVASFAGMTNGRDWTSGLGTPSRRGSVRKTTLLLFLFLERLLCGMQEMLVVVILLLVAVGGGSQPGELCSQRPHQDKDPV